MFWIEEKKWVFEYEEDFPGTRFFYFETGDQGALWNVLQVILKNSGGPPQIWTGVTCTPSMKDTKLPKGSLNGGICS